MTVLKRKEIFMADQKIDNLLNLAMDATPEERRKSENLNIGYDMTSRQWDIIVKYSGPESGLAGNGIQVVPLLGGYAVVTLPESEIDAYSDRVQVEFIEKPKRLYFELFQAKGASCIRTVQTGRDGLTGKGILIGIVDSGVDYFHPDFRNADGSSRILRLWDQSIPGKPPQGYVTGTEYTEEEIGWRAVYRREYTKMKMINVVTDKKICYNIYTMCKNKKGKEMEIKDEIKKLRESTGMNRKEFCEYFEIPYRTVTEWERGTRKMPDYVLRLLAYKVKMDNLIVKEDVNEE